MRLGATLVHLSEAPQFPTDAWARRLVAAGFESLWTPHVVGRAGFVPDPFVTLAVAAAVTDEVELGTATLQVPLLHPAELAFRVRSLQAVCGDRVTLGLSPGSTATDYDTLDRDFGSRFEVFGRNVDELRTLLGPVRPPLLLGSWGKNVVRAAREFDGWLASGYRSSVDDIVAAHDRFRDAGGKRAIVCTVPTDDLGACEAALHRYAAVGFDDAVVLFGPDGPEPEQVRNLLPR